MSLQRSHSVDELAKYSLHGTSDSRSSYQTSTPDKPFAFLKLPREIRDGIYALTLDWIVLSLDEEKPRIVNNGLFNTCTQIRKELRIAVERCVWAALDRQASLDTLLERDLPKLFDTDRITHLGLTIELNPFLDCSGEPRLSKLFDMRNLNSMYVRYIHKPHPRTPLDAGVHKHLVDLSVRFSMADVIWTVPRGVKLMWGSALEEAGYCSVTPPGFVPKDDLEVYAMAVDYVAFRGPEPELCKLEDPVVINPTNGKQRQGDCCTLKSTSTDDVHGHALTAREASGRQVLPSAERM